MANYLNRSSSTFFVSDFETRCNWILKIFHTLSDCQHNFTLWIKCEKSVNDRIFPLPSCTPKAISWRVYNRRKRKLHFSMPIWKTNIQSSSSKVLLFHSHDTSLALFFLVHSTLSRKQLSWRIDKSLLNFAPCVSVNRRTFLLTHTSGQR